MIGRLHLITAIAAALTQLVGAASHGSAQAFPNDTVKIVTGHTPMGAAGRIATMVAAGLEQSFGRKVEVTTIRGDDGNKAAAHVAKAPADGHTLLLTTTGMVTFNQLFYRNLPFNPQNDFRAVCLLAEVDNVLLVRPDFAARSIADLVSMAKAAPGTIRIARVDLASTNTLAAFLLAETADIELDMTAMKWDTLTPGMGAVVSNGADMTFQNLPAALPWIRDGRLRALATTGRKRSPALTDVPTVGETVADYRASAWFGIVAPHATPRDTIRLINSHISRFLAQPDTQARFAELGADTIGGSQDDFEAFILTERNKWRRIVAAAKIGTN